MPEVDEREWDKLSRALKSPVDGDDDEGGGPSGSRIAWLVQITDPTLRSAIE